MENRQSAEVVDFAAIRKREADKIQPCPPVDSVDYALVCISNFEEDLFEAEKTLNWFMANTSDKQIHELKDVVKTLSTIRTELDDLALAVCDI